MTTISHLKTQYKKYSLTYKIILLIIISSSVLIPMIFTLLELTNSLDNNTGLLHVLPQNNIVIENNNVQDPVRWWPSGLSQTWGILGGALAVYRVIPGSHRTKTLAALCSFGITIPSNVYFHAVENPNGFNRLMYSWMQYKQTGNWPANIPNTITDKELDPISINHANETLEKFKGIDKGTSSFLPQENLERFIPDQASPVINFILKLFRPNPVEGYLDDLIGQQLFIQILLIIVTTALIGFFIIYMFIQIMNQNKDFIINKFGSNKFVLFYIKYQILLIKISSVVLPVFILFGLIELFVGLYFLITHPLPYDKIPVDLHIYISK